MFIIQSWFIFLHTHLYVALFFYFSTCSGAMIHFDVISVSQQGVAEVDVTVTGGDSKNNVGCQGGADALTIPYSCMATARGGGSVSFTCENRPIMFGGAHCQC